jgi:hypothetical protein
LLPILFDHNRRYPLWTVKDLYKLVHQAALGSEHALSDEARVRRWLSEELARLGPGPGDPLIDPISPDGRIVRVHLRPFKTLHLDPEALLSAFIRTAREFPPSPSRLGEYSAAAARLATEGELPFDTSQVSTFFAEMQAASYPAAHHSPAYVAAYHPAYRVIARELLLEEIAAAG